VPEASNADNSCGIIDSVNDSIGWQYELSDVIVRKFANDSSRTGKYRKGLRFFDERQTQSLGCLGTIRADVEHDISRIGYRSRSDDYLVVHEAIIFSTSASGTPSPRSS